MTSSLAGNGCSALASIDRCDAELPDNPQCAPNYHFGMLLGVDDLRAEQGFHVGRLRRHQRVLHGRGVVAGYPVKFDPMTFELRVGPGHAIDALGRDLVIDAAQCVSLPRWWVAHRHEDPFQDDAASENVELDLDVVVCHATCLDSPVPAIAEPCAGDAADIGYSRVCEMARLALVRTPTMPRPPDEAFHLLQTWLGRAGPRLDADGKTRESDAWLIESEKALRAKSSSDQPAERARLWREVLARSVAENSPAAPPHDPDEHDLCVPLARFHVKLLEAEGQWSATVNGVAMGVRDTLLPTSLLQTLFLSDPPAEPPSAGVRIVSGGARLEGRTVSLVFDQPLAKASITKDAFAAAEFVPADGWKRFTPADPTYDETDAAKPTVRFDLGRDPAGKLVRISVIGDGTTPLLGANLIPAGAPRSDSDGRTLTTSIAGV